MIFSAPEGVLSGNRVGDSTAGLTESEIVKAVVDQVLMLQDLICVKGVR